MELIQAKCTSCGGDIQLDRSRETGFCLYCGSKVIVNEAIQLSKVSIEGKVEVAGVATIETLLIRGDQFYEQGDFDKAEEYFNRILDIEPANPKALEKMELIETRTHTVLIGGIVVERYFSDEIIDNTRSKNKIAAIKILRECTGLGLAEAKDYIDRLLQNDLDVMKTNREFQNAFPSKRSMR